MLVGDAKQDDTEIDLDPHKEPGDVHIEQEPTVNKGILCFGGPRISFPFFLDLIEDHTRTRWYNVVVVSLVCIFAFHLTVYVFSDSVLRNNATDVALEDLSENYSVAAAVAEKLSAWAAYLAVSWFTLLASSPVFLASSVWQNPWMTIPSSLFLMAIIAGQLYLTKSLVDQETGADVDETSPFHILNMAIIALELLIITAVVVAQIGFFLHFLVQKGGDWNYEVKKKYYMRHVRTLLEPAERIKKFPEFANAAKAVERRSKYLPDFIGSMFEPNTVEDVNNELFFRTKNDFFYPARLLYAAVLSAIVSVALSVLGLAFWQTTQEWIYNSSLFAATVALGYSQGGTIREIVHMNISAEEKKEMIINFTLFLNQTFQDIKWMAESTSLQIALGVTISATLISMINAGVGWYYLLTNYPIHIYKLRQGRYKRNIFNTYVFPKAAIYFGLQTMQTGVSFFIWNFVLYIVGMIIVFGLENTQFRKFLSEICLPSAVAYVAISLPLEIIYSTCMTKDGGKMIKSRCVWVLMDYFNLILQLIRGSLNFLMRLLYWIGFFALYMIRLDVTVLPKGWRTFDDAHCSYWAMLCMDHIFNNPAGVAFRSFVNNETLNYNKPELQKKRSLQYQFIICSLLIQNPSLARHRYTFVKALKSRKEALIQKACSKSTTPLPFGSYLDTKNKFTLSSRMDMLMPEQINEFKEAFWLLDRKETGTVTPKALKDVYTQLGERHTVESVADVFKLAHMSSRDGIDLVEFMAIVQYPFLKYADLDHMFDVFQGDADRLTWERIFDIFIQCGCPDLTQQIQSTGILNNGTIKKKDFICFMLYGMPNFDSHSRNATLQLVDKVSGK